MYPKKLCMFPFVFLAFKCFSKFCKQYILYIIYFLLLFPLIEAIVILKKWTVFDQFGDETGLVYDQSYVDLICLCKDSSHCTNGVMQVIKGKKDVKKMRDTEGNGIYQIQFPIKSTEDLDEYNCQLNTSAESSNTSFKLVYRFCK